MYKSLNDAATIDNVFTEGNTRIWYMRDMRNITDLPKELFVEDGKTYDTNTMDMDAIIKQHVLLGSINHKVENKNDASDLYMKMQGEYWSPRGQANSLIIDNGMSHTSMSAGDIIETPERYYVLTMFDFAIVEKV